MDTKKIPPMIFVNFSFKSGLNTTIRKGTKWNIWMGIIEISDVLEPDVVRGKIFIVSTIVKQFRDIRESDLIYEHNEDCRSIQGLRIVLEDIYGQFNDSDAFTIVQFASLTAAIIPELPLFTVAEFG